MSFGVGAASSGIYQTLGRSAAPSSRVYRAHGARIAMLRNGTDRVFPVARTLLRRNIRAENDRLWGGFELAASRPTAPPQWAAVQPI
jgi:hypothetical protein